MKDEKDVDVLLAQPKNFMSATRSLAALAAVGDVATLFNGSRSVWTEAAAAATMSFEAAMHKRAVGAIEAEVKAKFPTHLDLITGLMNKEEKEITRPIVVSWPSPGPAIEVCTKTQVPCIVWPGSTIR